MNKIAAISDLKKNFIDQVFELTNEISTKWPKIKKSWKWQNDMFIILGAKHQNKTFF